MEGVVNCTVFYKGQNQTVNQSIKALETIRQTDNAFYPLKSINELRRNAVELLENAIIKQNGLSVERNAGLLHVQQSGMVHTVQGVLAINVTTLEQLNAVCDWWVDSNFKRMGKDLILVLEYGLCISKKKETLQKLQQLLDEDIVFLLAFPYILRHQDEELLQKIYVFLEEQKSFGGVLIRSMEALGFLREKQYSGKIYADAGFYVWNRRTLAEWKNSLSGFTIPHELRGPEWRMPLTGELPAWKMVYGRLPMMQTANCVAKSTSGCRKDKDGSPQLAYLTDRYQTSFPVMLYCGQCMNIIYNSVPLSLHGEWRKWKDDITSLFVFTVETKKETTAVLRFFDSNTTDRPPYKEYTTGHEKRGVE